MGGGDLNLKKSWHPHTMKNQERVWKAEEQAKMEERKLQDLRKEIHEERDREDLRRLGESSGVLASSGGAAGEAKLEWMYKNSTELINREEYLLGRKIDKSFETLQAEERRQEHGTVGLKQSINHVEHDCVPFSIRAYRNLQSTEQVDMQRKTMEDPLMLIKQREMESRRKLLENPVKLKEIHRILKTEQDLKAAKEKKSKKSKKSKKKKHSKRSSNESSSSESDEDLDRKLARQVSKLKGDAGNEDLKLDKLLDAKYRTISKQLDIASKRKKSKKSRRKSSDSSNESSTDERARRRESEHRRRDDRNGSSRLRENRRGNSPEEPRANRGGSSSHSSRRQHQTERRRSPERGPPRRERDQRDRSRGRSDHSRNHTGRRDRSTDHTGRRERSRDRSPIRRRHSPSPPPKRPSPPKRNVGKPKLSEADREARLREMMDNATWREADRTQAVRKHREAYAREEAQNRERDFDKEFINKEVKKAISNHNSIGDRIRANLNNIQRTSSAMDTNFARK
ncbi:pre-mRNA-splicing factor CWC25 homolog [Drosophila persimilis]|uniref:pre-mRNA-splicing factor CWC25 homolog n=1 Tax=Drosophila persimilis TaxID=7234 RepID=UPI00017FC05B|nr:pre-mRNA-splicing factor CWC25 homolog [Drosophila persimilis]